MAQQQHTQLELFSQHRDSSYGISGKRHDSLLDFLLDHERLVLLAIGFIITGVVSYSLGVEKGKQASLLKSSSRFDVAKKKLTPRQQEEAAVETRPVTVEQAAPSLREENTPAESQIKEYIYKYTIQLVTYRNKTRAEKEAQKLKQKGLTPVIISKSGYAVLCVGNFSTKSIAQSRVVEFRKKYHDCFVRRL